MDACCKFIASKISGKTPEELRTIFNITNDYTPEEEEKVFYILYILNYLDS